MASPLSTQRTEARLLREQEKCWTLEAKDRNLFIEALLNPPEPGARVKAAAKRYRTHEAHIGIEPL